MFFWEMVEETFFFFFFFKKKIPVKHEVTANNLFKMASIRIQCLDQSSVVTYASSRMLMLVVLVCFPSGGLSFSMDKFTYHQKTPWFSNFISILYCLQFILLFKLKCELSYSHLPLYCYLGYLTQMVGEKKTPQT